MTSGRLQCVNNPYEIITIPDKVFNVGDGTLYKNQPMWVVSETTTDLQISKIATLPVKKYANQIVYKCTLPVSFKNNENMYIRIYDIKNKKYETSSFLFNSTSRRFVANVIMNNLKHGTDYDFYYSILESNNIIFKNIKLQTITTPQLTLEFLTPGHTVSANTEISFSVRVNHTKLCERFTKVSISPHGELINWTLTPVGDIYVIRGKLSQLHHKSTIHPVVQIHDVIFYDQTIRYKCLSCVEDIVMCHSVGFEYIHMESKTVYTQPVTCFIQLISNDKVIQNSKSEKLIDVTFHELSQDTIYQVHTWVTDEFSQTSKLSVHTIQTKKYNIRNVHIQFTHRDTLVFGSFMKSLKFVINDEFKQIDIVFKSNNDEDVFIWKNVEFNKNDMFYEVSDGNIRLAIDNVIIDELGPLMLYVRGISSSGKNVDLSTNKVYTFDNDRTPPNVSIDMRILTCASKFTSILVKGYTDKKNIDFDYKFWITTCEARCVVDGDSGLFDALTPVDVRVKPRIDFQDLIPDTPYAIVVKVETVATGSLFVFRSLFFQTIPDPEFVMLHCIPTSTHICSAIIESLHRKRVVINLNVKHSYMVKRNSVIQLIFKNGGSMLLHTSKENHYLLTLSDGSHFNITKYTYNGFSYDTDIKYDLQKGSVHY
jgi:hypothetical protein